MGKIKVEGIRVYAYHGCLEEESKIGANYQVDVQLDTSLEKASLSDKLEDTIDYGHITRIVTEEMAIRSKLIESVAKRITNRIKKDHNEVNSLMVRVTKFYPPVNGHVEKVSVEISD